MKCRATRTLLVKSGIIKPGETVPSNYPRMKEAIRCGWVVPVSDDPTAVTTERSSAPAPAPPVEPVLVRPVTIRLIADCDFLLQSDKKTLADAGIVHVGDLTGWDGDALTGLSRIGETKATKLIETFNDLVASGYDRPNPDKVEEPEEAGEDGQEDF